MTERKTGAIKTAKAVNRKDLKMTASKEFSDEASKAARIIFKAVNSSEISPITSLAALSAALGLILSGIPEEMQDLVLEASIRQIKKSMKEGVGV